MDTAEQTAENKISQTLSNNQVSSKLPLIIGGLILVLIVGAGSYYLGKQSAKVSKESASTLSTITPTQTTVTSGTDETDSWKTYFDSKVGFSIKYPQGWKINVKNTDLNKDPNTGKITYFGQIQLTGVEGEITLVFGSGFGGGLCSSSGGELETYLLGQGSIITCNENGSRIGNCGDCGGFQKGSTSFALNFKLNNENNKTIINQILSTFKFIDQNQIASATTLNDFSIPNDAKIIAINNQSPEYSFQYPKPKVCNGCYGGVLGIPYSANQITDQTNYQSGSSIIGVWSIEHVAMKKNVPVMGAWNIINSNFFDQLFNIKVNETAQIISEKDNKSYSFTRMADKTIDGVTANIYSSNFTTGRGYQTKLAVFTKGEYRYLLAVNWGDDKYAYIFDLVTSSFKFSLRADVTPI